MDQKMVKEQQTWWGEASRAASEAVISVTDSDVNRDLHRTILSETHNSEWGLLYLRQIKTDTKPKK